MKKPQDRVPAVAYEPTTQERSAVEAHFKRRGRQKPAPRMKISRVEEATYFKTDHKDERVGDLLLMEALGTADPDFLNGLVGQLAYAGTNGGGVDERGLNFMLATVRGVEPKDQVEAMLAAQMAAVHSATMTYARRLNHVETSVQQDSAERALNRLARTFASQVEGLRRYRTGGEQKVTVQHVSVTDNAQAIVGNVSTGGGGEKKK
jgi:hypothetical protein